MPKRDSQGRFIPKNQTAKRQPRKRRQPTPKPQAEEPVEAYVPEQSPAMEARQAEEYYEGAVDDVPYQPYDEAAQVDPYRDPPAAGVRRPLGRYQEYRDEYDYQDEYRDQPLRQRTNPVVWILALAVVLLAGWLIYDKVTEDRTPPAPSPVVVPSTDLRVHTDPIKAKLAYDPEKARIVRDAYGGLRDALEGPSGKRVADSRVLEQVQAAFLDDLQTNTGVSVGAEIDAAIGGYLGIVKSKDEKSGEEGWEPKSFDDSDRRKLVEIVGAISKAAGEAI